MSEGPAPPAVPPPPVDPASPPPAPRGRFPWIDTLLLDSVTRGIVVALLLTIAGTVVAASCLFVPVVGQVVCVVFAGASGLAQLLWIVPLDRWADRRGRFRLRKGLWIGASVVFLLNATCWGVMTFPYRG